MRRLMKDMVFMGAVGAGALWMTHQAVRRTRCFEFAGKSVIVTGGSRGLGLVIALQLVSVGARVAICARTEEDVRATVKELRTQDGQVFGMTCDVRDRNAVSSFVERTVAEHGSVSLALRRINFSERQERRQRLVIRHERLEVLCG